MSTETTLRSPRVDAIAKRMLALTSQTPTVSIAGRSSRPVRSVTPVTSTAPNASEVDVVLPTSTAQGTLSAAAESRKTK